MGVSAAVAVAWPLYLDAEEAAAATGGDGRRRAWRGSALTSTPQGWLGARARNSSSHVSGRRRPHRLLGELNGCGPPSRFRPRRGKEGLNCSNILLHDGDRSSASERLHA